MNTTNFDNALSSSENYSTLRRKIVRLYIALGALNGNFCHAQAEWLISQLDVSKMYRSRFERFPKEYLKKKDLVFSVPKAAVDFVQKYINNKEFHRYVFAFLEGYNFFVTEAKKSNVKLSAKFVIDTAPQYIFHEKASHLKDFVQQLLEGEKNIEPTIADKILHMYSLAQAEIKKGAKKNIIETEDSASLSELRYKYLNLNCLQSYLPFTNSFRKKNSTYYRVEAENVFTAANTHAIEIIDGEYNRKAVVILNLFDEGELFADIMDFEKDLAIDTIQAIKRALIDQRNRNDMVTGISIGKNEDPNTTNWSPLRDAIENSNEDWTKDIQWIKFEYFFKNPLLGIDYKGYRVRFKVDGQLQCLNSPRPQNSQRIIYNW